MQFNFAARIKNIRRRLNEEKLDALVILTVEDSNKNVYYLSGFSGTTGALVVTKDGAVLAVDARYTERARKEACTKVVETPSGKGRDGKYTAYVDTALRGLRLPRGARIGFEALRVPHGFLKTWEKALDVKLVPTEHVIESLRQIKDEKEVLHLTRAARITSRVFRTILPRIRPGLRECDIATLLDIEHLKAGTVAPSFKTIVASGANSAIPHHETGTRKVKAGDPLILDFGGIFPGGYCSDLTRTIFVPGAKPNAKLIDMYRVTLQANRKAFRALKPGITWKEYDGVARNYIREKGYGDYFLHGLGHSLGLETHDPYDYARDAFTERVVLTNEPGIYIPGVGGIRIEDDVVVTKNGARIVTTAPYLRV